MNTLKFKLLAASLFACSAAFAQTQNPPPTTSTPSNTPNNFTPQAAYARTVYGADSYVLQRGQNQYASVDQTGYYNTADIYQNYYGADGSDSNNATQTQNNTVAGGAHNTAYIAQFGQASSASQSQSGSGNVAKIQQYAGTGNNAQQTQTGNTNEAAISQTGDKQNAIQEQNGDMDKALITQSVGAQNYAEQHQTGGSGNQANTTQSPSYGGAYSYTTQMGSNNQATVNQH